MDAAMFARFVTKIRFEDRDEDLGECWTWTGSKSRGYGNFAVHRQQLKAHRVAYEHWCGQIPEKLDIDHLCRNTACVNPRHLEAVSHRTNLDRGLFYSVVSSDAHRSKARALLSEVHKRQIGRKVSPETRAKLSATHKLICASRSAAERTEIAARGWLTRRRKLAA